MTESEPELLQGSRLKNDTLNSTDLLRDNSAEALALLTELRKKLKKPLLHVHILGISKNGITVTYKSLRHTRNNIKNLPLQSGDKKGVKDIIDMEEGFNELEESVGKF
jgi:hypothetical protein